MFIYKNIVIIEKNEILKTYNKKLCVAVFYDNIISEDLKKNSINYLNSITRNFKTIHYFNFCFTKNIITVFNKKSKEIDFNNKIIFHDFFIHYYEKKEKENDLSIVWDEDFNRFYNSKSNIVINKNYITYRKKAYAYLSNNFSKNYFKCIKYFYEIHKCIWSIDDYKKYIHTLSTEILQWCEEKYSVIQKTGNNFQKEQHYFFCILHSRRLECIIL